MTDRESLEQIVEDGKSIHEHNALFMARLFVDMAKHALAQGIEAGTAETAGLGPKDESPVAESDAPKT